MQREIYKLDDDLRNRILKSFMNELVIKKTRFQKALLDVNKKYINLYHDGKVNFYITPYYIEAIFIDHLQSLKGYDELLTQSPIIKMGKAEMTTDQIVVKLFKKNFSVLKDFDKSIEKSVMQMNKNNIEIDALKFHNLLAKYMFKSLQAQLSNVLKFIKTANKEDLQTIIHEAQSSLSK